MRFFGKLAASQTLRGIEEEVVNDRESGEKGDLGLHVEVSGELCD